jgi:signal peptidase II
MKHLKFFLLALATITIDQIVKLLVYFNMEMHVVGEIPILGNWFKLHYTVNPGMAFGIEFGSEYGKLGLTLFRLVAMVAIAYYLYAMSKRQVHQGFLWCIALILGGAVGNVIDSTFYGVFLEGNAKCAENLGFLCPWFHGQVIDMFYINIWEGTVPDSWPLIGGNYYSLWPIFNIADAAIFMGVAIILVMQRRFFAHADHPVAPPVGQDPTFAQPEQEKPSLNVSQLS